jgi:hypothetical protein
MKVVREVFLIIISTMLIKHLGILCYKKLGTTVLGYFYIVAIYKKIFFGKLIFSKLE